MKLSMESSNDKYQNAVKKLSSMLEKYKNQNKYVLLVRRQSIICVLQGMIEIIYTTVFMLKSIHWKSAYFQSGKYVLPEHKPVICIWNFIQQIVHVGYFVKVTADFSPKTNRPLGEGFVADINGIGNTLLCNVKYTEV